MKFFVLLALMMTSQLSLGMDALPDGTFTGEGAWKSDRGDLGSYTVSTAINGNEVCSRYQWPAGEERHFCFSASFAAHGFFAIPGGTGYCTEVQCHYAFATPGGEVEETLTFVDHKLYRIGSKIIADGSKIVWQEALVQGI